MRPEASAENSPQVKKKITVLSINHLLMLLKIKDIRKEMKSPSGK
ncbi:hypothetical protein [Faecalibaculum rodentium]|nr:hypothetical protein [Faecalibaculum rodentium]